MDIENFLSQIALFSGLTPEQYKELAAIVTLKEYKKGQTIFNEGDPGNGFYILASGQVKIYKISIEGKEQILHVFGSGEPFAEAAVFTGKSFPAHALALQASTGMFFPRDAFVSLLKQSPSLAMNMMAALSMRLKQFAQMIEDLSLKEVPGRLAAHLLLLSARQGNRDRVELEIGKAQLASLLGTIPETLSRILAKFAKQGFIESNGATIELKDWESLEELAMGERRL